MMTWLRRNRLLMVLALILAFNLVDRLALGLLLQDIKTDLELSDTQLGILTGIAFALFYSVVGIPIARWADCGNRANIIALCTAIWSAAVMLCGAAGTFLQLLLMRVGVSIGEAGCIPPAHSLIADHFTREERPRAVALFALGGPLGMIIGYSVAGWLNELYGWRVTFVLLGLPGLVLAIVARLTLKETRTFSRPAVDTSTHGAVPIRQVIAPLWLNRTYRHILGFSSVAAFFAYGIGQWQPAFFVRSHGLSTGDLGTWLAFVNGGTSFLGTYLGGVLATRYAAKDEPLQLKSMGIAYGLLAFISPFIYLVPGRYAAFALMAIPGLAVAAATAPLFATIQTIIPEDRRAMSIAVIYLFSNLIGMGLGPLLTGVLSDCLRLTLGEESLRYSLIALCPGYLWAAWHACRASTTVREDIGDYASAI